MGKVFIWIGRNPLKNPDSAKENQVNPSYLAWFYLVLVAVIFNCLAAKPNRGRARAGELRSEEGGVTNWRAGTCRGA
jgi:hypothetical protein